jgi:hypothetical protein
VVEKEKKCKKLRDRKGTRSEQNYPQTDSVFTDKNKKRWKEGKWEYEKEKKRRGRRSSKYSSGMEGRRREGREKRGKGKKWKNNGKRRC